jgi:hypothetical protein
MTENRWLTCVDPPAMLEFLRDKVSDRKLRLFACACCRCLQALWNDERIQEAVLAGERYADGLATLKELKTARKLALEGLEEARREFSLKFSDYRAAQPRFPRKLEAMPIIETAANIVRPGEIWETAIDAARLVVDINRSDTGASSLRRLVHDLFGNPFRSVRVDPAWLGWRDGVVVHIAQAIYDERRFQDLPILADALEESGCTNTDILGHCRGPGPHVRGCWVVDGLLGKRDQEGLVTA